MYETRLPAKYSRNKPIFITSELRLSANETMDHGGSPRVPIFANNSSVIEERDPQCRNHRESERFRRDTRDEENRADAL